MVCNDAMNEAAIRIIDAHGGDTALAKKLGLPTPMGARRVHNWRSRGIPSRVQIEHYDLLKTPPPPPPGDTEIPPHAAAP